MQANLMLLFAAAIWGFGFVAQRLGMNFLEPFAFNGVRFLLGSCSLLPLNWWFSRRQPSAPAGQTSLLKAGLLAGAVLFIAASLQQVGLLYTTAAKAGFITGLYLILVPILGLLLKHTTGLTTWLGAVLAAGSSRAPCPRNRSSGRAGRHVPLPPACQPDAGRSMSRRCRRRADG